MNSHNQFSLATLGRVISVERHNHGWTQVHLSKMANINRAYLSDVEQGHRNITMDILARLASTLGLTASELIIKAEQLHKLEYPVLAHSSTVTTT